jgi:hypothetical protein
MKATNTLHRFNSEVPAWHAGFLALEPAIRRKAKITFRLAEPELREELVAEVVAGAMVAYARLFERGKVELAFASPLARFAIRQVRSGRTVGNQRRIREVLPGFAQQRKGFQVERLDYFDEEENCWREIVVEDKRATPADIAACRIDFASWLRLLPNRRRKIALALAAGETTSNTATKFGLTAARISQLRQWLKQSWEAFQGGKPEDQSELAPRGQAADNSCATCDRVVRISSCVRGRPKPAAQRPAYRCGVGANARPLRRVGRSLRRVVCRTIECTGPGNSAATGP